MESAKEVIIARAGRRGARLLKMETRTVRVRGLEAGRVLKASSARQAITPWPWPGE